MLPRAETPEPRREARRLPHFVIAKNGTIYQLAPLDVMCRHVVGLNNPGHWH